jgi:hypothetical protein
MTMTPAALKAYRLLRTLHLPTATIKKIAIAADGRPCFTRLSDAEFNVALREVRRVYPAWNVADPPQERKTPPDSTLSLTPALHGRGVSGTTH